MKNYEQIANNFCADYPQAKDFKVLEVGSDWRGGLLEAMAPKVREITGINLVGNPRLQASNALFERGDIRETDFPDNTFDLVISFAVFEHIGGISEALSEIHRVLKPGGEFVTVFGPIWSCMWGHHLWVLTPRRQTYEVAPYLPPWCHLLMKPDDLRDELLFKEFDEKTADAVVKFTYESDEQNRVSHNTYLETVEMSKLHVVKLSSNRNTAREQAYLQGRNPIEIYLKALEARHGPNDYLTASLSMQLRK